MLIKFAIHIGEYLITLIGLFLPSYEKLPLPDWYFDSWLLIFAKMTLILELPVIRAVYHYFQIFVVLYFSLLLYNLVLKGVSTIPKFHGVKHWRVKSHKEED